MVRGGFSPVETPIRFLPDIEGQAVSQQLGE